MITVVYCTRESNPKHKEHLIKSSGLHKYLEVIEIVNNGESLTKAYNRGYEQASNDIVVFCHDDITIETKQWGNKLIKLFEKNPEFGIIGVAGSKYLSETGRWWDDRKSMYGRVKHTHNGKSWLSEYSADLDNRLEEVVNVDGLFFAVKKGMLASRDKEGNPFDETVEGFHFYDVDFSFYNFVIGACKVGVTTKIRINHLSIGETNQEWEDNREKFVEKNKDLLPQRIVENFENRKLKILIADTNEGQDLTGVYYLATELQKMNCSVSIVSNYTEKDIMFGVKTGAKLFSLQEPPTYKLGDGKFSIQTAQGPVLSEAGKMYKIGMADFDVIFTKSNEILNAYKNMYPECKFVDINTDEYNNMDKEVSSMRELFVKTFNSDAKSVNQHIDQNV